MNHKNRPRGLVCTMLQRNIHIYIHSLMKTFPSFEAHSQLKTKNYQSYIDLHYTWQKFFRPPFAREMQSAQIVGASPTMPSGHRVYSGHSIDNRSTSAHVVCPSFGWDKEPAPCTQYAGANRIPYIRIQSR